MLIGRGCLIRVLDQVLEEFLTVTHAQPSGAVRGGLWRGRAQNLEGLFEQH